MVGDINEEMYLYIYRYKTSFITTIETPRYSQIDILTTDWHLREYRKHCVCVSKDTQQNCFFSNTELIQMKDV